MLLLWEGGTRICRSNPCAPAFSLLPQMSRECFARYLKLACRTLSDAAAIAAASAAGITSSGALVIPLEDSLRAAEAAAADEARGYGSGGGAAWALEESIAAGGGLAAGVGRRGFVRLLDRSCILLLHPCHHFQMLR